MEMMMISPLQKYKDLQHAIVYMLLGIMCNYGTKILFHKDAPFLWFAYTYKLKVIFDMRVSLKARWWIYGGIRFMLVITTACDMCKSLRM